MAERYDRCEALHSEAMQHANDGMAQRYLGEIDAAVATFRKAWELERTAAMELIGEALEPSRSILFRSAASLALLCGEIEDARRLAHLGLAGTPDRHVRQSLQGILSDADARARAGAVVVASVTEEIRQLRPNDDPPEPIDVTWKHSA